MSQRASACREDAPPPGSGSGQGARQITPQPSVATFSIAPACGNPYAECAGSEALGFHHAPSHRNSSVQGWQKSQSYPRDHKSRLSSQIRGNQSCLAFCHRQKENSTHTRRKLSYFEHHQTTVRTSIESRRIVCHERRLDSMAVPYDGRGILELATAVTTSNVPCTSDRVSSANNHSNTHAVSSWKIKYNRMDRE